MDISKKIYIIILNYNGWSDTIECLNSMRKLLLEEPNISLILVDNNSTNESVLEMNKWIDDFNIEYLSVFEDIPNCKEIEIIKNDVNLGFSGGNNVGISYALSRGADYVMLLNNDTIVTENFINPLYNLLENDAILGMVGPSIHDYYNHEEFILGGKLDLRKCTGYHFYNSRVANETYVSFLSGCCWLIKASAIEQSGLLDENYFLYVEDVDYCFTMLKNGYKMSCTDKSVIYHKESKSSPVKDSIYYYNTRNRFYFNKKANQGAFFNRLFFYFFISIVRTIQIIIKPALFKYIFRGFLDYHKKYYGVFA